jgi:hypothetical protein
MATSAENFGMMTALQDLHIMSYIAGALPCSISSSITLAVAVASLTWLVYDIALTADAEVRPKLVQSS